MRQFAICRFAIRRAHPLPQDSSYNGRFAYVDSDDDEDVNGNDNNDNSGDDDDDRLGSPSVLGRPAGLG